MAALRKINCPLGRAILRGPLLDRWVSRRGRQLDHAYCAQIVRTISEPLAPPVAPAVIASGALRQILVIADCLWEQNSLLPELARIAATRTLDLRPLLKQKPDRQSEAGVLEQAVEFFAANQPDLAPDVILLYARPTLLSDAVFEAVRRAWRCPLLGMNLDDKLQFFRLGVLADQNEDYARWAGKFDLNLTSCLPAVDWYRQRGHACLYVPPGVHQPPGLAPPQDAGFQHDFSFVGAKRVERTAVVERIQRAGIPIQLFGRGWSGSRWVEDLNEVYRHSQLNLGIGFPAPSATLTNLKGRDFECPGAGACYLTTYNWELPLHYELGREILCYRTVEELIEMYAYYHKRPEECLKIAQAAWRRSAAEHTWEQRFRKIFRQAGFKV